MSDLLSPFTHNIYWSPVSASSGCLIVSFSIVFQSSNFSSDSNFVFKSKNSLLALISVYLSVNLFFSSSSAKANRLSVSVVAFLGTRLYFPSLKLSTIFATPTVSVILVPFSFTSFTICSCLSSTGIFFDIVFIFSKSVFIMLSLRSISKHSVFVSILINRYFPAVEPLA